MRGISSSPRWHVEFCCRLSWCRTSRQLAPLVESIALSILSHLPHDCPAIVVRKRTASEWSREEEWMFALNKWESSISCRRQGSPCFCLETLTHHWQAIQLLSELPARTSRELWFQLCWELRESRTASTVWTLRMCSISWLLPGWSSRIGCSSLLLWSY